MPNQTLLPDVIGNTPLLYLRKASELTGCHIYGKAEFMNPGQSVKDRAALYIIKDAVERGDLRPGGRAEGQSHRPAGALGSRFLRSVTRPHLND